MKKQYMKPALTTTRMVMAGIVAQSFELKDDETTDAWVRDERKDKLTPWQGTMNREW